MSSSNSLNIDLGSLDFTSTIDYLNDDDEQFLKEVSNDTIELTETQIVNPFFVKTGVVNLSELNEKELYSNYKKVYILCTRSDFCQDNLTDEEQINILTIFNQVVEKENFMKLGNHFILTQASSKLLKNKEHYNQAVIIETKSEDNLLKPFNHNNYTFENFNEIIVPMIELAENFVNIYKEQYDNQEEKENILQSVLLDIYYNRDGYNPNYNSIYKKISNIKEADFWQYPHNCNYTINDHFFKRKFDYDGKIETHIKTVVRSASYEKQQDNQVKEVLNKLEKDVVKDVNYLEHIYRKEVYVDALDGLKDNKNRTYFATSNEKLEKSIFNKESVTELFKTLDINLHEKQLYDIFNTLLVSKEYCHLVLNNSYILDKMQPIISKYYHMYRYLFGYAWMCFYTEECIFKTKTTNENRYVFDINTVNKLPVFPVVTNDLHLNPYITSLVSKKILDSENNCLSVPMTFNNMDTCFGVCDLTEFKKRFNLFTTGDVKKNILDGIDWSSFAVSGSVISACMFKKSPLIDLVSQPEQTDDDNLTTFFSHFYPDSDIDLMCNKESVFDFMDKIEDVVKLVNKNIYNTEEIKLQIEPKKTLAIIIHLDYIKEKLEDINKQVNKSYSVEDVKNNMSSDELKTYFYKVYTEHKSSQNEKDKTKFTKENILYQHFFNITSMDDMSLYVVDNIIDKDNTMPRDSEILFHVNDYRDEDNKVSYDKNKIILKLSENIKFKLHSSKMLHSIEAFRVKGSSFFSVVARFHLPCVRAYYCGDNVYMMPSCVTAMMTGINIDYKYFAGIRDPIDILNKYRMRGFGILLNDNEKQHMVYYNGTLNNKWNNMFNVNIKNKDSISKFFGLQNMNSNIFKPLVFLKNFPKDIYNIVNHSKTILFNDVNDLTDFLKIKKKYDPNNSLINTIKLKTINENGKIEPLKKWVIDACWN